MNPFLHNHQEEDEGSLAERLHIRRALSSRKAAVPDVDTEWERLKARIEEREKAARRSSMRRRLWAGMAAAVAVAIVAAGVSLLLPGSSDRGGVDLYIAEAPAGGAVTVTTSAGKRTVMPPVAAKSAPVAVATDAEPDDRVVIVTPAGQEIAVVLPDSSKVWLWPNSRLEYTARFDARERTVSLSGEAYFDVTPMPGCPFIVHTECLDTRVYGTEFVVRAFGRKNAEVLLVEGSVGVSADGSEPQVRLEAGQEATLTSDGFDVTEFDPYPLQQWRDGMFFFEDDELMDILIALGKWYGVSIVAYNDSALHRRVHFVADRNADLSPVIKDLNAILTDGHKIVYEDNQLSLF